MEIKGKKILLLSGSRATIKIIECANKMGIKTCVTDWYKYEDSPAKQVADEYFMISTTDVDKVVELIKKEHIDGVFTGFTDSVLPYYADICKKAKLNCYANRKNFELMINKKKYKKELSYYGIPIIEEYLEKELENAEYPILVKPVDGSGTIGVEICYEYSQVQIAYEKAKNISKVGEVIIEKYLEGDEVTLFFYIQNGEVFFLAAADWYKLSQYNGKIPSEGGYIFPSVYTNRLEKEIVDKFKFFFKNYKFENGLIFVQGIMDNKGIWKAYDLGYRLTGSHEYSIFEKCCDFNPMKMLVYYSLTGQFLENDLSNKVDPMLHGKKGWIVEIPATEGTIKEICGCEKVKKNPKILDIVYVHVPGDCITKGDIGTIRQTVLRVIGIAESLEDLKDTIQRVRKEIHIFSTNGEEMQINTDFSDCIVALDKYE